MRVLYTVIVALLIGAIGLIAYQLAYSAYEASAIARSEQRLSLYQTALKSEVERLSHLPTAMAIHPDVAATVTGSQSPDTFNAYLKEVSSVADGSVMYVLDTEGLTIASSNYDTPSSFVGNNYKFRPYFTLPINGKDGRFFAIGVTTNIPGYFVSKPIMQGQEIIGVAVVKTELDQMISDWKQAGEDILVTDTHGVVIISSRDDLAYKTTKRLSREVLSELTETRKLGKKPPAKLEMISNAESFSGNIEIADTVMNVSTRDVGVQDWKVHYLTNLSTERRAALLSALAAMLVCSVFAIGVLFARSRREENRLRAKAEEAEQMRLLNRKLTEEITTRREAENQLRETQVELIQSSRLAALGKMSAAIVHEVNQPVTAIRTFTSSGLLLMSKGQVEKAKDIFEEIKLMTERLGIITSDLLIFSRKPVTARQPVDINQCIQTIARQFELQMEEANAALTLELCDEAANVSGSTVRFEQLIGNLLKNAMQSSSTVTDRPKIKIATSIRNDEVILDVTDNGAGVPEEINDQLFDPFFTTKPVGQGVGLGLALCYAIADETGGKITCKNLEDGGACFTVNFPQTKEVAATAKKVLIDG